jgi:hypothetical protein
MDKFSEFIPIIIGMIIFIAKIVSDSKKKQQQSQNNPSGSLKREPIQYGEKPVSIDRDVSWEQSRTNENDYRSLDPDLTPKAIPDIDYDKMTNVSVPTFKGNNDSPTLEAAVKTESRKLKDIRKLFKDKNSIQELMLLSEVLNKPKAHSRWQRNLH